MWQRCRVSCVTRTSNWYWLTVGQGLLSLQQVWVEGECLISSVSSLSFIFLFLPCPSLSSSQLSLLSLFSLSLGDNTKWPTGVDVSLNPNTINQSIQKSVYCRDLFFVKIRQPDNFIRSSKRLKFTHGCFYISKRWEECAIEEWLRYFRFACKNARTSRVRSTSSGHLRMVWACETFVFNTICPSIKASSRQRKQKIQWCFLVIPLISSRLKKKNKQKTTTYRPRVNFQKKPETHVLFFFGKWDIWILRVNTVK